MIESRNIAVLFLRVAACPLFLLLIHLPPTMGKQAHEARSGFQGQAVVHRLGQAVTPDRATVWVLFGSTVLYEGMPNHNDYIDSAALHFQNQSSSLWEKEHKALKAFLKDQKLKRAPPTGAVAPPDPQVVNDVRGLRLMIDDEALVATREWAEKSRSKKWQVKTLSTGADGNWSVNDLKPGMYVVVVRAQFGQFEVEWEVNTMVEPGQTITVPPEPLVVYKRPN